MTDAEAIELGKRAIMHATFRDIGSGGSCNGMWNMGRGGIHSTLQELYPF